MTHPIRIICSDSVLVINIAQFATIGLSLTAVLVCGRLLAGDAPASELEVKPGARIGSVHRG